MGTVADYRLNAETGIVSREMDITPEWAAETIQRHRTMEAIAGTRLNRSIDPHRMVRYARDVSDGRWRLNGEPIIIARSGRLLDGQHRLLVVMQTGCSIRSMVTFGVDESVFDSLGQGRARTPGDVLAIAGYSHANRIAAIAATAMIYAKHGSMHISGSARPTSTEIHGFVDRHASELIAVEGTTSATAASLHVGASLGSIVFLVWHRDEVQGFLEKLRNGVGMESDDMLRLVRDRLLRETMGGLARVHSSVKAAWLVKGWNGHVTGARARILKFDAQREEFPMIRFARQDLAV